MCKQNKVNKGDENKNILPRIKGIFIIGFEYISFFLSGAYMKSYMHKNYNGTRMTKSKNYIIW